MLILMCDAFDASMPRKLERFGEVTDDMARLGEAEVVLVRSKTKCTREFIDKAPKLKVIIRGGVGIDNIDKAYAESKGIIVHNTPKSSSIAVAELAFALMLSTPNHLLRYHNGMKEGQWLKKEKRTELYGKTLCLFGIGHIASEVADRAKAFGMKVVAYDKYVTESSHALMLPTAEAAVSEADYISLHMPLTPETKGMVCKTLLGHCKKHPVVINTCRALVVDEKEMVEMLRSGQVAWYCTDVWSSDPPATDDPLLKEEHVTMTPHVGANSEENLLRIGNETCELLEQFKRKGKSNGAQEDFFAGPSVLPVEVLEELKNDIADYQGKGLSMLEASHRGGMFEEMYDHCLETIREVFHIPEDYDVYFLGGGATLQFTMIPWNFLRPGTSADYLKSGTWSNKAVSDAQKLGKVNLYFDGTEGKFTTLPDPKTVRPSSSDSSYLYLCSNETIGGIEWQSFPDYQENVPMIADMSSDFFSRPVPVERFSMIYGGVQKNLGPAGATLIIMKKSLLERQNPNMTAYMDYKLHAKEKGLYNTPPVFSIWAVSLVMDWIKKNGGVEEMERRAVEKSSMVYDIIDSSPFWRCPVNKMVRSRMNVVFRLPSEELEAKFVEESKAAGMLGLKGHRSVGGLRASLYNACPKEDVVALCEFMKEFERRNG